MTDYATRAEMEAIERRLQAVEDKIDSLIVALKRWTWTNHQDRHVHPIVFPVGGGSRLDRPLFGFQARADHDDICECGEPASEHACPEVQ
jgi:hypothetical protein